MIKGHVFTPSQDLCNKPLSIFNVQSGMVMAGENEKKPVVQRALSHSSSQTWTVDVLDRSATTKYVKISHPGTGCVLEADGEAVKLKKWSNIQQQHWQLQDVEEGGVYAIVNRAASDHALTIAKREPEIGLYSYLHHFAGRRDQLWKIIKPLTPSNWMSKLHNDLRLSALSIPGTHDSATSQAPLLAQAVTKTQALNVREQLEAGIRYLDIRARVDNGQLTVYHGMKDMNLPFKNVVQSCFEFLQKNQSETIILQLSQERDNNPDFSSVFAKIFETYSRDKWYLDNVTPDLRKVRGKIVLFNRFSELFPDEFLGIDVTSWADNKTFEHKIPEPSYAVQDKYDDVGTIPKQEAIESFFEMYCKGSPSRININFNSVAGIVMNPSSYAHVMNPWLADFLVRRNPWKWNAIVPMDFVLAKRTEGGEGTEDAISNIIFNNYDEVPAWQ